MRTRNLKPGFFANETIGTADPLVQLLFAGLWLIADRDGRLEDRPARIKAAVFPYRNVDGNALLSDLASLRDEDGSPFIVRYEANGRKIIAITKFDEHQNPHPKEPSLGLEPVPATFAAVPEKATAGNVRLANLPSTNLPSTNLPSTNLINPPTPKGGETEKSETSPVKLTAQEFIDAWNAIPHFHGCKGLTGKRLRHFRARVRDGSWVETWRTALERAKASAFCSGAGEQGWVADVDWFLRADTVLKIMEGKYDERKVNGKEKFVPGRPPPSIEDAQRVIEEGERFRREVAPLGIDPEIRKQLRQAAGRKPDD